MACMGNLELGMEDLRWVWRIGGVEEGERVRSRRGNSIDLTTSCVSVFVDFFLFFFSVVFV